jgi:hypothetical protein
MASLACGASVAHAVMSGLSDGALAIESLVAVVQALHERPETLRRRRRCRWVLQPFWPHGVCSSGSIEQQRSWSRKGLKRQRGTITKCNSASSEVSRRLIATRITHSVEAPVDRCSRRSSSPSAHSAKLVGWRKLLG